MSDDAAAAEGWIKQFAVATGGEPPSPEQIDELLKLASVAAHSSERLAAPIACWMVGRLGLDPAEGRRIAESMPGAEA